MRNRCLFWATAVMAICVFVPGKSLAQTKITCKSDDGRRHNCPADTRGGVSLARQWSDSPCTEGYSWGYNRRGIWVDHGCRADFVVGGYARDNGRGRDRDNGRYGGDYGYGGQPQTITCKSDDMRRHYCSIDTRGGVSLGRQWSDSPCTEGYSWGYDRRGIWVDHGCRADFTVGGDASGNDNYGGQPQTITCKSDDMRRHYCPADTRGGVSLGRQWSDSPCREGYSWGYNRRGIWVDHGCRADFIVGGGDER